MFNLSDKILHDLAQDGTPGALREKLTTMAASVEEDAFVKLVARQIVERTRPQQAIPEIYGHYRLVVRDGIEFFLSQISCQRLIDIVISQLQLKSDVDTKERLVELAKRIPTLHKLGQIIARNPNIDPAVKKWLIQLEQLSFEGFVFPADLMLFRKAVFTLEGVLYDLDSSFDMDAAIMQYITALMAGELPMRFSNLFFPLADRSENYPSLISNAELQSLMVHQYADAVKSSYKPFAGYFTAWSRIFGAHLQ